MLKACKSFSSALSQTYIIRRVSKLNLTYPLTKGYDHNFSVSNCESSSVIDLKDVNNSIRLTETHK